MKLQNKQTGQVENFCIDKDKICSCDRAFVYDSLTQLQEAGWEDYEEPEVYWFINSCGEVLRNIDASDYIEGEDNLSHKEIGNYFETKEEAEKAVEKLRAWKRLEDKGIFTYIDHLSFKAQEGSINFEFSRNLTPEDMKEADKDLDLLFGGEE